MAEQKKSRGGLPVALGGIAMSVAAALALVSCSTPDKPAASTASQAPSSATPTPSATWQEELAAALAARPKTGQHVEVGNRPVTAADAKAWLDADDTCILSGAVKFSNQNNSDKFIASLLGSGQDGRLEALRQSLKTDENWATCASGLYAPGAAAFDTGRAFNLDIVNNQMAGRTVTRNHNEEAQITIVDNSTVRALVHSRLVTVQADGKVLDDTSDLDGGTLKVQNGDLVWVGPY